MSPRGGGGGGRVAIPGRHYVVDGEDRSLEDIGAEAWGKTGAQAIQPIWAANPPLAGKTVAKKGTLVMIPGTPPPIQLTGKAPADLTIMCDGVEIPVVSCKIHRTMDTGTDAWKAKFAWTPGEDKRIDQATRPFGYQRAAAYIGNKVMIDGALYGVRPEMLDNGCHKTLTGYSFTADLVDSSLMPPYEVNGWNIKDLAELYCNGHGVKVHISKDLLADKEFMAPFKTATAHEGEKVFDHLSRLVTERGGLVTSSREGHLLIWRAITSGKPVGTLSEGQALVTGWSADYDGRKLYGWYNVLTAGVKGRQDPQPIWAAMSAGTKQGPSMVSERNDLVPLTRILTYRADDTIPGNIHNCAKWKKNKHFVDALTLPFPVSDWFDPSGNLWDVNTLVHIVSPTLGVPKGYTFLIRAVEYDLEDTKRSAVLHVIPPEAYSMKDIGDIWTLE